MKVTDADGLVWPVELYELLDGWTWRVPGTPIGGERYEHDSDGRRAALAEARAATSVTLRHHIRADILED